MQQRALLRRGGDHRQRHRVVCRVDLVGEREDDVVDRGRTIRGDVSRQRHETMLRALHPRQVLHRCTERPPGSDADHQGIGAQERALQPRCAGLRDPEGRRGRFGIRRHHFGGAQTEALHQSGAEFKAGGDGMVDANLDEPGRHRQRHEPLGALPRDAELDGDLLLRVARDVVEPAGARRVVETGRGLLRRLAHPRLLPRLDAGRRADRPPTPESRASQSPDRVPRQNIASAARGILESRAFRAF